MVENEKVGCSCRYTAIQSEIKCMLNFKPIWQVDFQSCKSGRDDAPRCLGNQGNKKADH